MSPSARASKGFLIVGDESCVIVSKFNQIISLTMTLAGSASRFVPPTEPAINEADFCFDATLSLRLPASKAGLLYLLSTR